MLKKLIFTTALTLGLAACSGGGDKKDNNNLIRKYDAITGVYAGKMTLLSGQQHDVEIEVFTSDVPENPDQDGGRTRVTLNASYKKISPVGPGYTFTLAYTPEENSQRQLVMTNDAVTSSKPNDPTLGRDDVHTINAQIIGPNLIGTAKSNAGVIGTLTLSRKASESTKPIGNEEEEYYDRLTKEYQAIAGEYVGEHLFNNRVYRISLRLDVTKIKMVPVISGTFRRHDYPESAWLTVEAQYQPELSTPILTLTGTSLKVPGSKYVANFQGTIKDGVYDGSWKSSANGPEGSFVLKKVVTPKEEEPAPEPEIEDKNNPYIPKGKIPIPTPRPKYP